MKPTPQEKQEFRRALYIPVFLLFVFWMVEIISWFIDFPIYTLGILPKSKAGLPGIFFAPVIHADIWHLLNNSLPFLVLSVALFYFYRKVALTVISLIWIVSGLCVWIAGRESYHIGASGVIYGLAAFLFVSGILQKKVKLLALSLLVAFLYGSMIWGIFPLFHEISWEGHLFGMISGIAFAFVFSKEIHDSEKTKLIEEEEDDPNEFPYWEVDINDSNNNTPNNSNHADQIIR